MQMKTPDGHQLKWIAVFFLSILWCSQSGYDPHEGLAKFGYKLNMKVLFFSILL
jgi:hypothetical protein